MTEVADDKPADMVDAGEHSEDHKEDDADKNENLSADFIEDVTASLYIREEQVQGSMDDKPVDVPHVQAEHPEPEVRVLVEVVVRLEA